MDDYESRLFRALHKRLMAEIGGHLDALGTGNADDFAAYKRRAGEIAGMKLALQIAADIEAEARGAKRETN